MSNRYREFQHLNLPSIGAEMLQHWQEENTFQQSIDLRAGAQPFVFYEGPPSANGMPGIHHVISRTLKDLVCRYKTMRGFQVHRKGGWDTHGLPVELGVEKMLGITKEDIGKKISIAQYNETCRREVLKYKDRWDDLTRKMGYWVDLDHPYITFENNYIETLWWLLKQLYQKGLLYQSISIQPYSPAAGTGLSSHELNQPGTYKEVKDTSCVAMFRARQTPASEQLFLAAGDHEVFFLAWTTTPWTLPSNLGLTVGANIDYVLVRCQNPYTQLPICVVVAKNLFDRFFDLPEGTRVEPGASHQTPPGSEEKAGKKISHWEVLLSCKGQDLQGCRYEQLLAYEANDPKGIQGDPFRVVTGDFVTTEDGTGIVHTAPAFGADDFKIGQKYGLGILTLVDRQGKFVEGLGEFSGRYVKNYTDDPKYVDVNVDLCVKLKKENRAFKIEKFEHAYPHCWRTDKPILYYPLDAWFIRTSAAKDRLVALNQQIHWKPKSTGEGRFGNWLENVVDWNLSRSRYWGTPLPIWRTEDGKEEKCIGSIGELLQEVQKAREQLGPDTNAAFARESLDLHKPMVDEIVLVSKDGRPMRRVADLIDVWFDSGAMPFAQWGLDPEKMAQGDPRPFREPFSQNYPADFIAEGVDQTRGWFYTLHAISVLLFDSVAYKVCVSNGLVLDKNGNKMSKRLGNVVDPFQTLDQFGADATRWYLITNASPWESMKFDLEGIREVQRKFFGTLYNTYQFFALYANVDGFTFREPELDPDRRPEIDRWILSSLHTLVEKVRQAMDDYEPTLAGRMIEDFVDEHLSNWYVRLCRRRFWKGDYGPDKISAYQTLYLCLETLARLMAPVSPFFADWLYRNLNLVTSRSSQRSVHHCDFPLSDGRLREDALEQRMQLAQDASSLILSLRKKANIKVRQPLQTVLIPVSSAGQKDQFQKVEELIKAEVNVKQIQYMDSNDGFIKKRIKPNFIVLGKKLGAKIKPLGLALAQFSPQDIATLESQGFIEISLNGEPLTLRVDEVEIVSEDIPGWMVASKGTLTVALDIQVTGALENEGYARELVNRIQKIRKDQGYELTDKIQVQIAAPPALQQAVTEFNPYICAEILADQLVLVPQITNGTEIEVNDILLHVLVTKKA